MLIIDGGYLNYRMIFDNYETWEFIYAPRVDLFAFDSSESFRKQLFNGYKSKRKKDEALQEKLAFIKKLIQAKKTMPHLSIDGLEADDLVACYKIFHPEYAIVGIDKDYFQLPSLQYCLTYTLNQYRKDAVLRKLPLLSSPLAAKNFALFQMLWGDTSDNIPRLLPKTGAKELVAHLVNSKSLYEDLLNNFDKADLLQNAKLVLLPYWEFCNVQQDFFELWCSGHYWDKENWTKLYQQILVERNSPIKCW